MDSAIVIARKPPARVRWVVELYIGDHTFRKNFSIEKFARYCYDEMVKHGGFDCVHLRDCYHKTVARSDRLNEPIIAGS